MVLVRQRKSVLQEDMCSFKGIILLLAVLLITNVSSKRKEKGKKEWTRHHCECGKAAASPNSIIGREYLEKYPWVVNLMDKKNNMTTFCVGAIVSASLVLTSASCLLKPQINSTENCHDENLKHCLRSRSDIAIGFPVTQEPVTIFTRRHAYVKKITPHSYSGGSFDQKLVLLSMSLPFKCADAAPVCLGTHKIVKTWTNGIMSGWKTDYLKKGGVNVTEESGDGRQVDILQNRQCSKVRGHRASKQAIMCPIKNESESYCKGNAGAPIFVPVNNTFYLIGIMSKTIIDDNCEKHHVLPLISIDKYLKWVHKVIKKEENIHSGKNHL